MLGIKRDKVLFRLMWMFWMDIMLAVVSLPVLLFTGTEIHEAFKVRRIFFPPLNQTDLLEEKKNNEIILLTDGGNFCFYFFNTCKDTSQGEGLSARGISLNQKSNYYGSMGSIVFSPPATEVRHQHYDPSYSLVSIRGVCIASQLFSCLKCIDGK